ncbi:MAG: PAS domain-containing protein, partial [Candidatus Cloacimonadota bacterium]|nr:PAS domain-containing protein [Candidatus Cloacimonadota bacterium]
MKHIRLKIVLVMFLVGLFIWITVLSVGNIIYRQTLNRLLKQIGVDQTTVLSNNCANLILTNDIVQLDRIVNNMKKHNKHITYSFIVNSEDKLLAHSFGDAFPKDLINVNRVTSQQRYKIQLIEMQKNNIYDIAVPVFIKKNQIGTAHIGITKNMISEAIKSKLYIIIPILFISLLIILLAGFWFASQILKPVNKLQKSENAIKKSEAKFHSLFSEMGEGVYLHEIVYDNKGSAIDYRILEANAASEKNIGIKPKDAVGKLATELYGTKEAPYIEIYTKVAETGKPVQFEQYFSPLKKHFHISVYSPEKNKFATVFSDITERKQAEE